MQNELVHIALVAAGIFFVAASLIETRMLIDLFNGLLAGVMLVIIAAYYRLGIEALASGKTFTRVHRFAIGCALVWLAFAVLRIVGVLSTLWPSSADFRNSLFVAAAEFTAILGGVLQLTAPGHRSGYLHGRDGAWLAVAMMIGALASLWAFAVFRGP